MTPARQSSPGNVELTGPLPRRHACAVMSVLPNDYDSDPERFLSSGKYPHDDVHPYVAARLARARARRVLDVGGGNGRLARLLPGLSMSCLLIDLSPAMLALAPRPAVRADGSRLPVADASVDAVRCWREHARVCQVHGQGQRPAGRTAPGRTEPTTNRSNAPIRVGVRIINISARVPEVQP